MARGVRRAGAEAVTVPMADGGDGTLEVLLGGAGERARVETVLTHGPLGDLSPPHPARLGWLDRATAAVELAEAAGIRLLPPGVLDPLGATSLGLGELVAAALDAGARRLIVGLGGSASTDGGAGLLAGLGVRLLDERGEQIARGGAGLAALATVDLSGRHPGLQRCAIDVAVDTTAPLLGPGGAAAVFAPQKGATLAQVAELDAALDRLATVLERAGVAHALRDQPGAGAAGGCGYALAAVCGATLRGGAALVADLVGLDAALDGASLVLTGEGRLDLSTGTGKAPREVAIRAAAAGVPCVVLAGAVITPVDPVYSEAVALAEGLPLAEAMERGETLLEAAAAAVARRRLKAGGGG